MRLVVLAALALACAGCSDERKVTEAIGEAVRSRPAEPLLLASLTPFEWDAVYMFEPYSDRQTMCAKLKAQVRDCERVVPAGDLDEGEVGLAFVAGTQVVAFVRHPRVQGDFTPLPLRQPIAREAAVFRVVHQPASGQGGRWPQLLLR